MSRYITYEIEALENLKLARTNMQIDSQDSIDYIGGSAIRGAFIYKYIRNYDLKDINVGVHREKLLAGNIKFLNAYPISEGVRSRPLPKCYFAPKQEIKRFGRKIDIHLGLDRELPPGYEKVRLSEFVHKEGNKFTGVKVEKTSNLHINKREEKNKLFRYEAIKSGQVFLGIIKVEKDEYAGEVLDLFSNEIIYIGGSKGSGYGKSIIKNMKILDYNPEGSGYEIKTDNDHIYLIAQSDIIYKTSNGVYSTVIGESEIKNNLGLESVCYVESSIDINQVTSFNNKWNGRTPNIIAIKAGSVFKYGIKGKLDVSRAQDFMDRGIGDRKTEGFGRFVLATDMGNMQFFAGKEVNKGEKVNIILSHEEKRIIDLIENRIFLQRIEYKISSLLLDMDKKLIAAKSFKQWGTWKDFFQYLMRLDIEEGKEAFEKYMGHIEEKKGKSYWDMQRVKYKTSNETVQSLFEFFNNYMKNITNRENFEDEFRDSKISLSGENNGIDEIVIYRTNLKTLSELCRYQIRKEEI